MFRVNWECWECRNGKGHRSYYHVWCLGLRFSLDLRSGLSGGWLGNERNGKEYESTIMFRVCMYRAE